MKQNIPQLTLSAVCDCLKAYIDISPAKLNSLLTSSDEARKNDKLLTLHEVQDLLNVSHRHLYNLKERGVLEFIRIGSAVRIKTSAIEALINGGK